MLSNVTIQRQQGLGKMAAREDGTSGLVADAAAIEGKVTLGAPLLVSSLAQVEALGITREYDKTNKVLIWHHIRDFFAEASKGTKLYIMPVAKSPSVATLLETSCRQLINYAKGAIKLLAVTSMSEAWTDLAANISAAQALYDWAAERNKPANIILEGRDMGSESEALDLHDFNANRVSVVVSQDPAVAEEDASFAKYAQAGLLLGSLAAIPVSRDVGRVRSGSINVTAAGLSNGTSDKNSEYPDDDALSLLDGKGYIFLRKYDGLAGYYWSADHTAAPATDDCDTIRMGRTLDKAADLARLKALEYLRDDVEIDASTGYISSSVLASIETDIASAVLTQMVGEVSDIRCTIAPEQSLWDNTKPLVMDLQVVARGVIHNITINVYYVTSFDND